MSSDYDDLPPKKREPDDEDTAGGSMGALFGAALWIVPIVAVGGLIAYLLISVMHR